MKEIFITDQICDWLSSNWLNYAISESIVFLDHLCPIMSS